MPPTSGTLRTPATVPMMYRTPTIVAVVLFVPWGLALIVFIFSISVAELTSPLADIVSPAERVAHHPRAGRSQGGRARRRARLMRLFDRSKHTLVL